MTGPADLAVPPPSGEQVHLRRDRHHAVIVEVSGGVRAYEVDGRQHLDGYGEDEMCSGARGQLLVPWPNRLRDGRYDLEGVSHQLPLTEPEKMNAIHGLLRWESWRVTDRAEDRAVLEHVLHPRAGYPFALRVAAEYRVEEEGLRCTVTATNIGDRACPYGMGVHPYLQVDPGPVDSCWAQAPGRTRLITDERAIPTGSTPVPGTEFDFRAPRQIRGTTLDTAFTDVERESDGRAWVRLWGNQDDAGVGLWMDEQFPYYMLFTGDTLPETARRRRSLAVEPMTCAPNAFASGDGLAILAPGQSMTSSWGIAPIGPRP